MEFSKNTSASKSKSLLIKVLLISCVIIGSVIMLGTINFPSPNKAIEKIISNEKIKTVE